MQPAGSVQFGYRQHPQTGEWVYATTAPPRPWVWTFGGYSMGRSHPQGWNISISEGSMMSDLARGIPPPESWSRSGAIAFRDDQPFFHLVSAFQAGADGMVAGSAGDQLDPRREGPLIIATPTSRVQPPTVPVLLLRTSWAMRLGIASREPVLSALCRMLVNTAYESVKERLKDEQPIFEYFRHVRNAASHGGVFNFWSGEPRKPAEWRGSRIDYEQKGKDNPLFGTSCFFDFLEIGDVLLLLWDIEQLLLTE